MKYTIEEKARLKGMRGMIQLKQAMCLEYGLKFNDFVIKGNYIILQSKLNRE